ncbi:MAG: polyphosphate polymerase domain-containing protein [Emergencia sp.]|nr:polyphosphate polymerase domain-containing protein [Emergencia sp.]
MNSYLNNFARCEKKYLIGEETYRKLIGQIYGKLEYDQYEKYKICNIYFDTPEFDLIRHSVEKPLYKEKLRLRSYGIPGVGDTVFLEIKKKFDGIVYKRRICLPYSETIESLRLSSLYGGENGGENQIAREIGWFLRRYALKPVLYLSYDRLAMRGAEEKDLRITFDTNVTWRTENLALADGDYGQVKLPEGQYIMEIKTSGGLPLWLTRALAQLKIYPASYSKYGTIYKEELHTKLLQEERKNDVE